VTRHGKDGTVARLSRTPLRRPIVRCLIGPDHLRSAFPVNGLNIALRSPTTSGLADPAFESPG